jgi:hypothetical protein
MPVTYFPLTSHLTELLITASPFRLRKHTLLHTIQWYNHQFYHFFSLTISIYCSYQQKKKISIHCYSYLSINSFHCQPFLLKKINKRFHHGMMLLTYGKSFLLPTIVCTRLYYLFLSFQISTTLVLFYFFSVYILLSLWLWTFLLTIVVNLSIASFFYCC